MIRTLIWTLIWAWPEGEHKYHLRQLTAQPQPGLGKPVDSVCCFTVTCICIIWTGLRCWLRHITTLVLLLSFIYTN